MLDGDPVSPPQRGTAPQFSAHICCGQMAGCIKMPLSMDAGLSPGDFVLDGASAFPPPPPISGPLFIATKRLGSTWDGGRRHPRRLCVRWGASPPPPKGGGSPSPILGPFLLWPNGSMHQDATWYGCRPVSYTHLTLPTIYSV